MSKGWKQFERTLLVLLVLLLFVLTGPLRLRSGDGEQSRVTTLRTGWYQLSDGGRKEIQLPVRMETFGEGSVELWNDSLRPEDAGKVLSVGGVQYGPEVWLGETLLYRYEDNAFPKNDQMKGKLWADITLPQETGTEPLRLIYTQTGAGELIIEAPELGSRQEITGRHLQKVSVSLVIVVCMQCLGVISLCIYLYMRRQGIREERFLDVSLFLLVCGFWCLTDSRDLSDVRKKHSPGKRAFLLCVYADVGSYAAFCPQYVEKRVRCGCESLDYGSVSERVTSGSIA